MSDVSDIKAELLVLKAENAELRRERDFYFQQVTENGERAHGAIDALQAENAKLRELVRGLNWHIRTDGLCADCPLGLAPDAPYEVMCDVMIEELGIEVDA